MTAASASAPGKVVISGEYAVLDGAPAIAAAVSRRARVAIGRAPGSRHTVVSAADAALRAEFRDRGHELDWLTGGDRFEILDHVWRAARVTPPHALAISIDTDAFFDPASNTKLGLGSSAALVTALTAALYAIGGDEADVLATALRAHRLFQRGIGSGVDVACSASGGVIRYCIDEPRPESLQWPDGLHAALVWSGVPASTTAKLDALTRQAPLRSREELAAAARGVAAAWKGASAAAVIAALHAYTNALEAFSVDHGLGIFDAGHAGLVMPGGGNLVYKPCGAGGGDVGIALATDADALASFVERAASAGFVQLDAAIEPHGVQASRKIN